MIFKQWLVLYFSRTSSTSGICGLMIFFRFLNYCNMPAIAGSNVGRYCSRAAP